MKNIRLAIAKMIAPLPKPVVIGVGVELTKPVVVVIEVLEHGAGGQAGA